MIYLFVLKLHTYKYLCTYLSSILFMFSRLSQQRNVFTRVFIGQDLIHFKMNFDRWIFRNSPWTQIINLSHLVLVMGWSLKRRARVLKVELEPGPSLGPSEKVEPEPRWASDFYYIKAQIFWALLKKSSPSLGRARALQKKAGPGRA